MGAAVPQEAPRKSAAKRPAAKKLKLVDENEMHIGRVQDWADELSDTYLDCRAYGHRWTGHSARRHEDGGFHVVMRCTRCYGKRHIDLSDRGMPLRSRYVYPEGYLTEGIGQLVGEARGVVRLTSVMRTINKIEAKG